MVQGFTPVLLSGCRGLPSPCPVAGRARGRALGLAPTRALPGLAPHFASRDLLAVPARARSRNPSTLEPAPSSRHSSLPRTRSPRAGAPRNQGTAPAIRAGPGELAHVLIPQGRPEFISGHLVTPLPAGRTRKPLATFAQTASLEPPPVPHADGGNSWAAGFCSEGKGWAGERNLWPRGANKIPIRLAGSIFIAHLG